MIALFVRVFSRPATRARPQRPSVKVNSNGTHTFQPTVLIVSLDGFRPDYIDRLLTPNMHKLRDTGVAPEYMKPSFPSVTFPNVPSSQSQTNDSITPLLQDYIPKVMELSASTFLPVPSNFSFYFDPVSMETFDITDPAKLLPSKWWEGTSGGIVEPIWVTAERQGVISAIHMWPGSESVIHGLQATHVDPFKQNEALSNKVDRVMTWLDLEDSERPGFIAAYVPDIDVLSDPHNANDSLLDTYMVLIHPK